MAAEFVTTHLLVGEQTPDDGRPTGVYSEACRLAWQLYLAGTEQTPTGYCSAIVDPVKDVRSHLAEMRAGLDVRDALAVTAQRKVEAATTKRQWALRNDHWAAANVWQKEADVWQEVLDILGAQAGG